MSVIALLMPLLLQEDPFKIDLEKLEPLNRIKLEPCIKKPTLVIDIKSTTVEVTKEMHDFFLDELPFSVDCAKVFVSPKKKIKYHIYRESDIRKKGSQDIYYLVDEDGIFARIEIIEKSVSRRVLYIFGYIDKVFFAWARAVVIVASEQKPGLEVKGRILLHSEGLSSLFAGLAQGFLMKKTSGFINTAKEMALKAKTDPKKFFDEINSRKEVDRIGVEKFKNKFIIR